MKVERPFALVVHVSSEDQRPLPSLLTKYGVGTAVAACGREALDTFIFRIPDLILSPVKLPDMEGLDFLREIRELSMTTLVALTSEWRSRMLMKEVLHSGRIELLRTPIREWEVHSLLERLLSESVSSVE